jgi:hypothetical protein
MSNVKEADVEAAKSSALSLDAVQKLKAPVLEVDESAGG